MSLDELSKRLGHAEPPSPSWRARRAAPTSPLSAIQTWGSRPCWASMKPFGQVLGDGFMSAGADRPPGSHGVGGLRLDGVRGLLRPQGTTDRDLDALGPTHAARAACRSLGVKRDDPGLHHTCGFAQSGRPRSQSAPANPGFNSATTSPAPLTEPLRSFREHTPKRMVVFAHGTESSPMADGITVAAVLPSRSRPASISSLAARSAVRSARRTPRDPAPMIIWLVRPSTTILRMLAGRTSLRRSGRRSVRSSANSRIGSTTPGGLPFVPSGPLVGGAVKLHPRSNRGSAASCGMRPSRWRLR